MHREIDQDVDAVGEDLLGHFGIGAAAAIAPRVGAAAKAFGDGIWLGHIAVAMNLELPVIVGFQQRDDEK